MDRQTNLLPAANRISGILLIVWVLLSMGLSGCVAAPAILVQPLEWETPEGSARGWIAIVALDDPGVEVLVTGQLIAQDPTVGSRHISAEAVLIPTDEWARRVGADLAVNANFFGRHDAGDDTPNSNRLADIIGLSMSDGVVVSPPRRYGETWDDVLLLSHDGRARITATFDTDSAYDAIAGVGASEGAPGLNGRLVRAGVNTGDFSRVAPLVRHPRTAAGVNRAGNRLILVVIDGRQPGWSVGVTLAELADVLIQHGAYDAINLDGGGSSSFFYTDQRQVTEPREATTNRPSDGQFRPVANHLGIRLHD